MRCWGVLLAVAVVYLGTTRAQTDKKCSADIVFGLDQSTSMTEQEFSTMTLFSALIIKDLKNFGEPDGTRTGIVKFSTRSRIEFDLDKYSNASEASTAALGILFDGGKTNTHLALRDMKIMLDQGRPNVEKVGIIITDGNADDPAATLAAAKAIHNAGYNLAVIAIGSAQELEQLKPLASSPDLFKPVADFSELSKLKKDIDLLVCKDECPKTQAEPQVPQFRQETARPVGILDVGVDLLQAEPFSPIVWSAQGLCTGNDTAIVDVTTAYVGEVIKVIDASQTLQDFKKTCYRASMDELLDELKKSSVDCKKIAKLMTCSVKVLRLITETINPDLIPSGVSLRDTWTRYSQTVGSVTDPLEAANIVARQEQVIKDWEAQRDATADAAEKTRLQKSIDDLKRVVDLNKLKSEYDVMVKDMVKELAKTPREPGQITALQNRMAAQLRLMKAASDDTTEQNGIQTALTRLEKVIDSNDKYRTAVTALKTEENRRPIDAVQLLAEQKNVQTALNELKTNAGSPVEGNAIQTVIDGLSEVISVNELINDHNNVVTQITTGLATTPLDSDKLLGLKNQQLGLLKQIRDTTQNGPLKTSLQGDIDFIEKEVEINGIKNEYNKHVQTHNDELTKDPVDKAKVADALQKMVAELKKLLPVTEDATQKTAIEKLITDNETALKCYQA